MRSLIFSFLLTTLSFAQVVSTGEKLPFLHLETPSGDEVILGEETRLLIVAFDKAMGKTADRVLRDNADLLEEAQAVYVTDISQVPGFVWSMFMKPAFQKYDYPVVLLKDEELALRFPRKDDHLTLLYLRGQIVTDVVFVAEEALLRKALKP